jgi:phosphoenolpyruvate carboxylase
MRKIPSVLFTQHPDHANIPYWADKADVSTEDEILESYICFQELQADEIKWDWEGKLVDEAFLEKLLSKYYDYFKEFQIGRDIFVTYRLPNPRVQSEFRLGRAFMGMISAASLTEKSEIHSPPLFEAILPMTETAEEIIDIQEAFRELNNLEHRLYKHHTNGLDHIELIPLIEEVHSIIDSDKLIKKYIRLHQKRFKFRPEYLRPYIARSDPALNAGIVPTVLAIKMALSRFVKLEKDEDIRLYPMLGCAALPFRGGLTPLNIDDFVNEYKGMKTVTIQSAFRYDYDKEIVLKGLEKLKQLLPISEPENISTDEEKSILQIINIFEKEYKSTVENESIANIINKLSSSIPNRRERVLHTGLFGYSRGVGKVKLPRAIKYTGAMYSLGIPPELIGTGRGLKQIKSLELLSLLKKYYVNIHNDLARSGCYLNKDNLIKVSKLDNNWRGVMQDIDEIENFLEMELAPKDEAQEEHKYLTTKIMQRFIDNEDITEYIVLAAKLRKSIG